MVVGDVSFADVVSKSEGGSSRYLGTTASISNCAGEALGRRRKKEDKIDHSVGLEFHKRIGDRVE
jgi:thymidine phosphorylase